MSSFGSEKGVTIRMPSTANLMIDSADRVNPTQTTPYAFTIVRPQALLNGFFHRVATTEVVLEWCNPNIGQSTIGVDISGVAHTISVGYGIYTVAELLDEIVIKLNELEVPDYDFSVLQFGGVTAIDTGNQDLVFEFTSDPDNVLARLDIALNINEPSQIINCPDLRPHRYIDFVCSQLTYPQSLKDASSQQIVRDVLCRWYFSEDVPENLDKYGFPILQGYTRFTRRRIFNPPKYIQWDNNLPVGNLTFEVYGEDGALLPIPDEPLRNSWLMTLQLSEN